MDSGLSAAMTAATLSVMLDCDVRPVVLTDSVHAYHLPDTGYLLVADENYDDDDWDEVVAQLPKGLSIDYADDGWDVEWPGAHKHEVFFATSDKAPPRVPTQRGAVDLPYSAGTTPIAVRALSL